MTQKFSQSHFRIQTRSQRHSEGLHPRPRRLTKADRTSQDLVRVHCYYWSMVVLWSGLHSSGDLPAPGHDISLVPLFFWDSGFFFLVKKK